MYSIRRVASIRRGRTTVWGSVFAAFTLLLTVLFSACATTGSPSPGATPEIVQHQSAPRTVEGLTFGFTLASCASGEQLVSGGYIIQPDDARYTPVYTYPANLNTWAAEVDNRGDTALTLSVVANCIKTSEDLQMQIVKGAEVSMGPVGTPAKVVCPAGSVLTGGGHAVADDHILGFMDTSAPNYGEWDLYGIAATSVPLATTAYALCATQHVALGAIVETLFSAPSGGHLGGVGTCPGGQMLFGGGYATLNEVTTDLVDYNASHLVLSLPLGAPSSAKGIPSWEVSAEVTTSAKAAFAIFVVCGTISSDLHPPTPAVLPTATPSPAPIPPTALPATATPAASAKLEVHPAQTTGFCANGQYPNGLTVSDKGTAPLQWSASGPQGVTITPHSGTVSPNQSQSISLSGSYLGHATLVVSFTSNGGQQQVTITCQ